MKLNNQMPIEEGNVIFHCSTAVLDEMLMDQQGKTFNKGMAEALDQNGAGFKFVVDYNHDYCVVPAKKVEDLGLPSGERTDKILEAMQKYIDHAIKN